MTNVYFDHEIIELNFLHCLLGFQVCMSMGRVFSPVPKPQYIYIAQKEMLVKIYALRVNVANLEHCNPHHQKNIYSTEAPWYIAVHWRLSSANCEV